MKALEVATSVWKVALVRIAAPSVPKIVFVFAREIPSTSVPIGDTNCEMDLSVRLVLNSE